MDQNNGKKENNQPLSLGLTAQNLPISATLAINELVEKKVQNTEKNHSYGIWRIFTSFASTS